MLEGKFQDWPDYFRNQLEAQWNRWISERYSSESALAEAWGALPDGERFGDLQLTPTAKNHKQYPVQRGSDIVRFFIELADKHYQTLRDFARAQAPEGIGVAVAPFSFDTQYRPSIPWLYSQSRSDVSNFGMYFWNPESQLNDPPSAYVMDSSTVKDKPTVIYETNYSRPNPYRAEYPYKLAALASWQDWDAVFFHYWGAGHLKSDEEFLLAKMPYPTVDHYWSGVHHEADPAITSAMALAGQLFLNDSIQAAKDPVEYTIGEKGIFGFNRQHGLNVASTTFTQGSRIAFDLEADWNVQPTAPAPLPKNTIIHTGEEISWNTSTSSLIIDTPSAKAYIGPAPSERIEWSGGWGMSSPTDWLAFGMVSTEGQPLSTSNRLLVSAVADAKNTSFHMDPTNSGDPITIAKAITNYGTAPVISDTFEVSITLPKSQHGSINGYDFALRKAYQKTIKSAGSSESEQTSLLPEVAIPAGLWISEIELDSP